MTSLVHTCVVCTVICILKSNHTWQVVRWSRPNQPELILEWTFSTKYQKENSPFASPHAADSYSYRLRCWVMIHTQNVMIWYDHKMFCAIRDQTCRCHRCGFHSFTKYSNHSGTNAKLNIHLCLIRGKCFITSLGIAQNFLISTLVKGKPPAVWSNESRHGHKVYCSYSNKKHITIIFFLIKKMI